ncbi:MAG: hypothetical protein J5706_09175, partial [Elusimicrobiales bacterium]|nr:hypothetical protein [Elusimicrobiales bacterium]
MKIINDKFNQLKEYAKVLQDTGKLKNRIKIVEIILCSALAVAVLRLFFMQCLPHAEYSAFYKEKFEDKYETDIDGAQYGGTISDINGAILVADNYSADIRISTAAMSSLSYRQRKNCKKEEKDEEISHKKIKLPFLEFKFAVPFVVSSYSPHCSSLENENFKKNSYFVEKFLQNNKDILQNRKKETSNAVYYKNLNISEFEKMQQQISGIRNVREMINGFKFYSPTGFFREICRTANNKTLSETQIGDLIIPEREKLPYNDENRKIYEKMTLNEYCMTAKFDSNIEMGLILSDIFEKNRFSPEILNSIEQSLSDEDKKKFSKKDMEILEDRNFSKKDYCKDSYDSVLCQKLYEYNLDQISSFFAENKSYFGNDYQNIISKIEKAKKSHPNKKENIKLPDSDKIDIKGTLASFAWRTSDFFDFIISVLKFKKEYERTIVIYTDNGGKFISVNKKKARQLSGKNKKLLRADAEMAK